MARETKVGLLAGLAFVICFAIILTNRGRDSLVSPPRPVVTDSGAQVPQNLQQVASRGPTRTPSQPPGSGADLAFVDRGGAPSVPAQSNSQPQPLQLPGTELTERNLTSRAADPPPGSILPQTTIVPGGSPPPITDPTPTGATHTVAAGETLSKIALAKYGSKSKSIVDAIHAANKSVMQSPDSLKVGMVLSLPNLPDASTSRPGGDATLTLPSPTRGDAALAQKSDAPSTKNATPSGKSDPDSKTASTKPATDSPKSARFYQVKKNDRWMSIARDQLGDPGRWKELHELNKDKFPDPQKIREGVRIKLPASKSVASAEGRR